MLLGEQSLRLPCLASAKAGIRFKEFRKLFSLLVLAGWRNCCVGCQMTFKKFYCISNWLKTLWVYMYLLGLVLGFVLLFFF